MTIQVSSSAQEVVAQLATLNFRGVFNPYSDTCAKFDRTDAPAIRRANLQATLEVASQGVDELWIALEPGHRGARRTGLAMTDDKHLADHANRWSLPSIAQATIGGPSTEMTAGIVWEALAQKPGRIFLWNVFPLHCHEPQTPLSNRRHTLPEREACQELTRALINMVHPRLVKAIGRDAQLAMTSLKLDCVKVRHPARGGKREFLEGVLA